MDILLVEDNDTIVKGLEYALNKKGYNVIVKTNVKDAEGFLKDNSTDLIILDVSLPDGNGFFLYERAIANKGIPTIFLTAKDDEEDIVKGFNLGAEDYMTKPFYTKELLVRVDRVLSRNKKTNQIKVKDIVFDMDKMIVSREGKQLDLSSLEIKILHLMFSNLNKVIRRGTVLDKIWEWTGNDVDDHTVTVYIKRIRAKLKTDIIITVKGIGYRIDEDEK